MQLLNPAILVSYLVMMYISVYPVAISVRRTNVYEEQSLGLYAADEEEDGKGTSFVGTSFSRLLSGGKDVDYSDSYSSTIVV